MAGTVRMTILANAAKARAELNGFAGDTEKTTSRIGGTLAKVGKLAAVGLGAGLLGAAAAGVKFAQAAIEDEKSAARMAQTFQKAAGATKAQVAATEQWITKQGKALGVADDELRPALSRLVTATGDVGKAQKLTSLAMDVSAGSGKSLESVSTALMKAQNGQVSSLSRLGINVKNAAGETVSFEEATKRMSNTFGGAAQSNANTLSGRIERIKLMASEAGESIGAKMLPTLTTFAGYILSTVVPTVMRIGGEIRAWASTMAERLAPTVATVAAFVTGTLVPAITAFAGYVIGTVVPAVVAFATKIGGNLAPVAVALAGHVQRVIAKFREWAPTIQNVITVVAKIVAKVIEFASVILGTVLPPLIRFASFMTVTVIGAVIGVIGVVARIITKVAEFGGAVIDGAQKVGQFASKVGDKIGDVVEYFTNLPGKITGALSGAGTMLVQTGKNIVQGLVNGLNAAKQWVIDKVAEIADVIPDWIARKLGIASPSKVTTYLGRMAGQGLADGVSAMRGKVTEAAQKAADKVTEGIKSRLDNAKGVRDSITSLRDSIAGALTGDLFSGADDESGSALDKFRAGLEAARATAEKVRDATKALIAKGVSKSFLEKLSASGNTDLIVQLGQSTDAAALADSYEQVLKVNAESGQLVAEQVIGTRLDTVTATIRDLVARLDARDKRDAAERREPVKVRFTAEQLDRIARGKDIQMDLDAYKRAGGRSAA